MKTILSFSAFALFSYHCFKPTSFNSIVENCATDSSIINHVLDGSIKEWPPGRFKTDGETGIQYAIDNDAKNLFLCMNIPGFTTQLKMMRMGMSLYIDLKGKKKESHGIEFPVKNENTDLSNNLNFSGTRTNRQNDGQSPNEQQRKPDIKAMQKMMSLNLFEMKVFGFSDNEPDDQQLLLPGSANIAFSWDSMDVMHIEYFIPLTMFGDVSLLNQKDISIGWKIHAFEMPKAKAGSENSSMENRSSGQGGFRGGSGRRSGGYGDGSNNKYSQGDREKMMEEQKFWTKYIINFPAGKKLSDHG